MKKLVSMAVIAALVVSLAGCDSVQRKFTRKKKETKKIPRVVQMKKYEKKPSLALYSQHYSYWVSWQSELLEVLGQNSKKDRRCIQEIVSQLHDMQNILVDQKAEELEKHVRRMTELKDTIFNQDLTPGNASYARRTIESEDRLIKNNFSPSKMKDYIRESFDDTAVPASEAAPQESAPGDAAAN